MSESTTKWLIVGALVLVVVMYLTLVKGSERRRAQHFDLLASKLRAKVDRTENSARFAVTIDERVVEVRDEYRGDGSGTGGGASGRYISFVTPLRGRSWDLHSVEIRRRLRLGSPRSFDEKYVVAEFGLPLREGWLTADVRSGIEAFFAAADSFYGHINIEAGNLIYRVIGSPRRLPADAVGKLLSLHAALALAIESSQRR